MRRGMVVFAVVLLAGCGGGSGTETPDLTEQYGCGYGFYASDVGQTTGLFLNYLDLEGASSGHVAPVSEIETAWDGQLQFGSDLFANWCDDVIEPDEPTPEITETWEVTGQVDIVSMPTAGECGEAVANLIDVVAHGPDDTIIEIGDITMTNGSWGCFAG